MKRVKVFIEKSEYGFSAYMEESGLNYGLIGEGKTVQETIEDFNKSFVDMRNYHERIGKPFEEIEYDFINTF